MNPGRRPGRNPWPGLLAAVLAGCLPLAAIAADWLQLDPAGLDAGERQASAALLRAAEPYLPDAWTRPAAALPRLAWRDDLPEGVHGRSFGRQLLLDRRLLRAWQQPVAGNPVDDRRREALAALVHELAHYHDARARWSLDPRLLDLAGWQQRPLRPWRERRNRWTDRSPDRYELHDPREFVAVNLEWFLLDREYACRRPALHRYFAARLQWAPTTEDCAEGAWFLRAGPGEGGAGLERLDPARVHAIDYLLAEGNDAMASRWGHAMLRLVVCAPGRAPGPDCRLDLQHHRVVSFRAFVDDVQVSSWRGLTGRYPSRMFLLSLDQVIDEYTRTELRGLQSIPLQLAPAEIAAVLERAAQLHWGYDGRYYFIGNNCAVETWKLLQAAVPRLAGRELRSVTPTGLLRRMQRAGLADASVLADRAEAVRQGYYFEAANAHYQSLYAVARDELDLPQARVEDWLRAAPSARASWIGRAGLRAAAAMLVLEQAALRREELRARDVLKRRLGGRGDAAAKAGQAALRRLLGEEAVLVRPALLGGAGYGLPQGELAGLQQQAAAGRRRWQEQWRGLQEAGRRALPAGQVARLEGIEANLVGLGKRLAELDRAQGGIVLP